MKQGLANQQLELESKHDGLGDVRLGQVSPGPHNKPLVDLGHEFQR